MINYRNWELKSCSNWNFFVYISFLTTLSLDICVDKILAFRLSFLKQLCSTVDELKQFMQNTLLFVQSAAQSVDTDKELETSLESLQQLGHVIITNTTQSRSIEVTHLGQATFKGAFLSGKYLRTFPSTEIYLKLPLVSAGIIQLRKRYGSGGLISWVL